MNSLRKLLGFLLPVLLAAFASHSNPKRNDEEKNYERHADGKKKSLNICEGSIARQSLCRRLSGVTVRRKFTRLGD